MKVTRFPLGRTLATPGALAALEEAAEIPGTLLKRHVTGDWGDVDEDDRRENEHSLVQGCRRSHFGKMATNPANGLGAISRRGKRRPVAGQSFATSL